MSAHAEIGTLAPLRPAFPPLSGRGAKRDRADRGAGAAGAGDGAQALSDDGPSAHGGAAP